jgi:protein-tyrosine phosphatase
MPIRVCFVCLGNICRSPTAEALMRHVIAKADLSDQISVDSAGTSAHHVGEAADPRSARAAERRGIHLTSRSRQWKRHDFDRFEYVIAMDRENRDDLERLAPDVAAREKITLLRSFDGPSATARTRGDSEVEDDVEIDVPDPYYAGGDRGFERVLDICDAGCRGLLSHIRAEHGIE